MAKVKMVLGWWIPMVLITVALMTPAVAEAKTIKIWPDQLKTMGPNSQYFDNIAGVSNGSFYAPLTLPLGAKITKVIYYHYGETQNLTEVRILRVMMGAQTDLLASGYSTNSTGAIIPVDVVFDGDSIIRAGYRYYIWVYSAGGTWFKGAKITY